MPHSADRIQRITLCEESMGCDIRLDALDTDWLRRAFSQLFDRAARAVMQAGLDLDDVIIERFAACTAGSHGPTPLEVPSLTDVALLRRAANQALAKKTGARPQNIRVVSLSVRVIREMW